MALKKTTVKVDMHLDRVMLKIENATDRTLHKAALQMEFYSKLNINFNNQIKTGFMLNSVYVEGPRGSTFSKTRNPTKEGIKAPRHYPPRNQVAVVVGAVYAIYQEFIQPFIRPAAQTVADQFGGIATPIYKVHFRD